MFKYNQGRDRFVPDRHRSPYSFYSLHHITANHQYDCASNCGEESDFLEPFECERQQEQQHRAFRQLQSYMSLESIGGHLLRHVLNKRNNGADKVDLVTAYRDVDLTWPIRMVGQRRLARKSNHVHKKSLAADLLLDMPNLSNDWMTKILDWSSTGYLTAAIESSIHMWSCHTQSVQYTIVATDAHDGPTQAGGGASKTVIGCLKWDAQGEKLGYSFTVEPGEVPSFDTSGGAWDDGGGGGSGSGGPSPYTLLERMNAYAARDRRPAEQDDADVTYLSPSTEASADETSRNDAAVKSTGRIKVWLLNAPNDNSNYEQKTSNCGCVTDNTYQRLNGCRIIVMDWLANGRVLVTGCTRATVTFFRYDFAQKKLITTRVIHKMNQNTLITCLHVSQDKWSRHLAVATYSTQACILKVWRIEDPLELCPRQDRCFDSSINVTRALTDRYDSKQHEHSNWLIKAFAWHPWKYALMCYAVTSGTQDGMQMYVNRKSSSWFVLANACKGQVLKRIEQTASNCCPTMNILHVNTHSMTFSRLTGELLVSATTVYSVRDNAYSSPILIEKHSVVVMHALDRIVETLSSSHTDRGLFFAWSPDGKRIALTSSDESLRIWNFWPAGNVQQKIKNCSPHLYTTNATSTVTSVHLTEDGGLNSNNYRLIHNRSSLNGHSAMSELSLDAARIIK